MALLARVERTLGRPRAALDLLERLDRPNAAARCLQAEAHLDLGQYAEAARVVRTLPPGPGRTRAQARLDLASARSHVSLAYLADAVRHRHPTPTVRREVGRLASGIRTLCNALDPPPTGCR